MDFILTDRGTPAGSGVLQRAGSCLELDAHCTQRTDAILRLYGTASDGRLLRIGVFAPDAHGVLRLHRRLTAETLRQAGFSLDAPPTSFVLGQGDAPPAPVQTPPPAAPAPSPILTGDPLLDALLSTGQAQAARTPDGELTIRCPFQPGAACPMAFALSACRITGQQAVLTLPSILRDP